jgi:mono/diheme cytochrome c family protein
MRLHRAGLLGLVAIVVAAPAETFDHAVQPVLSSTCLACHNEKLASGNLNLQPFLAADTVSRNREAWEKIVRKVSNGEMPPKGIPRPPDAKIAALLTYLRDEFDKADRAQPPDPGRVTAHRLNRNEYSNTIRDLLALDFRADKDFPTDDTGYGFDNIGDVLTISPVLMEKYLAAAERLAARAIGADPLPKPIEVQYHAKDKTIRRIDASAIEATHRVDFDAEYIVRFGLPGERSTDAKPVMLGFFMDGKLLHTQPAETKPSKLV